MSSTGDGIRPGYGHQTMRIPLRTAASAAIGYSLGTLPSAHLAVRLAGVDEQALERDGTGNPGAMNATHVLGTRWGAAVSAADIAKGVAAAAAGRAIDGERGANIAATAAVIGHCHPLGRRGGKGVATSIGQVIGTFPVYLPVDVVVAVSTAALPWFRRRTEVAATVASAVWVGCGLTWWRRGWSCGLRRRTVAAVPVAAIASSAVIQGRFRAEAHLVDAHNERETAAQ